MFLLSPEIPKMKERISPPSSKAQTGLISIGGADPTGLTPKILESVVAQGNRQIAWDVVLGPASVYEVSELSQKYAGKFQFIVGADLGRAEFLDLLSRADIVITNGGTTLYESLALGRPTAAIAQNGFEEAVIDQISAMGGCIKAEGDSWLDAILSDSDRRLSLSEKGGSLIDGLGCQRVADLILSRII